MIKFVKGIIVNEKLQDTFEITAKLFFLLYTMLGFNSVAYGHKIVSFVMWPAFALCAGVIGWRALRYKRYYKMPGLIAMALFLVSHVISSVINHNYALKDNFILLIYLTVFFLLFYVYPLKKEPERVKREFNIIAVFFIIYALIGSIISIIMLIKGYSSVSYVGFDNYEVVSGFRWGRLWGVFLEPGRAALIMMVAVILTVYMLLQAKRLIVKISCGVAIVPMFIYIIFSDSRTTVVSIFFALSAGLIAYIFTKKQKSVLTGIIKAAVCIVISLLVASSPVFAKDVYNTFVEKYNLQQEAQVGENKNQEEKPENKPSDLPEIERNYDLSGDISNRRFDLWKSGAEMFIEHPVFGYSFNGIRPYAMEKMPETYLVGNGVMLFSNFHNEVINVLCSQGVTGLLIFLCLIAVILVLIFRNYRYIKGKDALSFAVMIAVIFGLASGAMFNSLMLYASTASSPFFWGCLGFMVYLLKNAKEKYDCTELVSVGK